MDEVVSILPKTCVPYDKWLKIDDAEVGKGKELNKVREKIKVRESMLKIAK